MITISPKVLFRVDESWTDKSLEISRELEDVIRPIFEKYSLNQVHGGYRIRDLEYIARSAVTDVALILLLEKKSR